MQVNVKQNSKQKLKKIVKHKRKTKKTKQNVEHNMIIIEKVQTHT